MKIALINNGQIVETKEVSDAAQFLRKGWVEVIRDMPAFDETKERLTLNSTEITATNVTEHYVVTASPEAILLEKIRVLETKKDTGYNTGLGFNLAVEESDRSQFTQMLVLINSAQMAGLIDETTPQIISDINGNLHQITTSQFREIILGYGIYCKDLWDETKQLNT